MLDEDLCSGCRICEHLCSYSAIEMNKKQTKVVAYVLEALSKDCGGCGMACPTKVVTLEYFTIGETPTPGRVALMEEMRA